MSGRILLWSIQSFSFRQICQQHGQDYEPAADDHSCSDKISYQKISEDACAYRFESIDDGSIACTDKFDTEAEQQDSSECTYNRQQDHEFELFSACSEQRLTADQASEKVEYSGSKQNVACSNQRIHVLQVF